MTNTAPSLPSDADWIGVPIAQLEAETEKLAAERGAGQAEWLDISWESTARRILQLIDDGDPVLDEYGPAQPFVDSDLAGWDDPTVRRLIEEDLNLDPASVTDGERDLLVEAYVQRYYQAYWDAVSARCQAFIAEEDAERAAEALCVD